MTKRTNFEAMLEALINEDQEQAKNIFHDIIVGKSREIYEQLLAEELEDEEEEDGQGEEEEEESGFGISEGEEGEEEEEEEEEGEEEDSDTFPDFDSEEETPDFEADEEDEGELEDRVMDLEKELDALKREFDELMDTEREEHGADEFGSDFESEYNPEEEEEEEEEEEFGAPPPFGGKPSAGRPPMMEYTKQVGGKTYDTFGKLGNNGPNTKSVVAGPNDMGGEIVETGKPATEGKRDGLLKSKPTVENLGQVNTKNPNKATKLNKVKTPPNNPESADSLVGSRKRSQR